MCLTAVCALCLYRSWSTSPTCLHLTSCSTFPRTGKMLNTKSKSMLQLGSITVKNLLPQSYVSVACRSAHV